MEFRNEAVRPSDLPKVSSVDFQPLSPVWRRVELSSTAGWYLLSLPVAWGILSADDGSGVASWWPFLLSGWAAAFFFSLWIAWKKWENAGYALREHDILYREGVLFTSRTIVPYLRIQHSEISRGPLERWAGLATLRIYTAGGNGGDLQVVGLPYTDALRIKEYIAVRTGTMPAPGGSIGPEGVQPAAHD